ncbi:ABC transporter substrate-binding protein [Chitinimonas viridis]|uniref:ABC transporter substrate-binding protein n=1 Tax=Chitinimonas viridis TaxID=664880 RepID=A0ABT8B263_9NEIS|nr:ABC transporter substrate-binding protein [Chitinimonas viridis]MDN3575967.1 ABC transporter substrate-binding protein [Chitinimonas viridis]
MKLASIAGLSLFVAGLAGPVAAQPADMNKTLHTYFEAPESGFDPAKYSDHYSGEVNSSIFESLLAYDYLARPQTLIPRLSDLPQVLDDGKTFIFKIRPGIYFADDPVFKGKKREVVATDVIYTIQRIVDPNSRGAPWDFMFKGKVIGLDEKIEAAKNKPFDFDKPIEGLQALDKYTVQIKLKRTDYNLPYIMAAPATGLVAREAIEAYGENSEAHPVGTGPYMLKSWQRRNRIILVANPNYRGFQYKPVSGPGIEVDQAIAKQLEGKTFPRIGTIDIRVIETPQASWLSFQSAQLDIHPRLGNNYSKIVAPGNELSPKYKEMGWRYFREAEADITYYMFNMDDKVVGGNSLERIALRRAIALSYNQAKELSIIRNGQGLPAQSPLAPQINGYDPNFKNVLGRYSPSRGNALLDMFGYKDCDGDGLREQPGCKPLTITYMASTGADGRDQEELLLKGFGAIGIKLEIVKMNFSDLLKNRQGGTYQFAGGAWGQDYPDAENFMQLLYGPNAGPVNESRFRNKDFDKLYEQIAAEPQSEARNERLRQMSRIVAAYVPWIYNVNRIRTHIAHPWVSGYKPHPDNMPHWYYLDVDVEKQRAATSK